MAISIIKSNGVVRQFPITHHVLLVCLRVGWGQVGCVCVPEKGGGAYAGRYRIEKSRCY